VQWNRTHARHSTVSSAPSPPRAGLDERAALLQQKPPSAHPHLENRRGRLRALPPSARKDADVASSRLTGESWTAHKITQSTQHAGTWPRSCGTALLDVFVQGIPSYLPLANPEYTSVFFAMDVARRASPMHQKKARQQARAAAAKKPPPPPPLPPPRQQQFFAEDDPSGQQRASYPTSEAASHLQVGVQAAGEYGGVHAARAE
jgi:hypothetical protein